MKDLYKTFVIDITENQRWALDPYTKSIKPGEALIAQVYGDGMRVKKLTAEQSLTVTTALMGEAVVLPMSNSAHEAHKLSLDCKQQPAPQPGGEREALIALQRECVAGLRSTGRLVDDEGEVTNQLEKLADMLAADAQAVANSQAECDTIAEINHGQWLAIENVRALAARHRKEEWAQHMLRFCDAAGSSAKTLRATLRELPGAAV